jgi:hypothetical protein
MSTVQDFYDVRRDGKIIPEGMTFHEIIALGEKSLVVEARWKCSATQKSVSLKSPFGVAASVVQGRQFVVARIYTKESDSQVTVFNCDGSVHLNLSNTQKINGQDQQGEFYWFQDAHHPADGVFGVVFQCDYQPSAQYWMDIDAATGKVLKCTWTK